MSGFAEDRYSWGRLSASSCNVTRPRWLYDLDTEFEERAPGSASALAVGLGRSYGDTGLNTGGEVTAMEGLDKIIAFDRNEGRITVEAGASLSDILSVIVPCGYFLPTTPGTRFVTAGGAVANDVHGKNHHQAGAFGNAVEEISLLRSDGSISTLSRTENPELFAATIGGLGLTGFIRTVTFRLERIGSAYLDVEDIRFGSLAEFFEINKESVEAWPSTVSWIDCLQKGRGMGRGIFSRGRFRDDGRFDVHPTASRLTMPMELPGFALNGLSIRAFNALYYAKDRLKPSRSVAHYAPYFYPLDSINQWNLMYGRRGFYQYQCVVPEGVAEEAIGEMLTATSSAGLGSFLAVLKTFGDISSPGLMSFPMPGATLALDFPNKGERTLSLFSTLDAIVSEAGGRLYPAKDARMPRWLFEAGYPELEKFRQFTDPAIGSDFWRRMNS